MGVLACNYLAHSFLTNAVHSRWGTSSDATFLCCHFEVTVSFSDYTRKTITPMPMAVTDDRCPVGLVFSSAPFHLHTSKKAQLSLCQIITDALLVRETRQGASGDELQKGKNNPRNICLLAKA